MKWRTWNWIAAGLALAVLSPWAQAQTVLHGRISYDAGSSMVKGVEDEAWSHAAVNTLILPGDTLWADEGGSTEVEFSGGSFLRLADGSKMEVASLSPTVQVRAWEGAFYAQRIARSTGDLVVEMPAGTVTVEPDSSVRFDVVRDGGSTISVRWGRATLVGRAGGTATLGEGQRVWIDPGMLPSTPAPYDRTREDAFDTWNRERSKFLAVGPESVPTSVGITEPVLGTTDLAQYGEWVYVDSRPYWRPTVVVDFVPYRYGYWSTVPRVGNVWVGNYPFCYTTSHYGRWAHNDRYGWIWSYDRAWSPAWCATLRYNDYYVWAPVDYYCRPVVYGTVGLFNVGGVSFSIASTSCVPVSYFGHGWNYVRPIYPSLCNDIVARPYQVNIWNININSSRRPVPVPYNRHFDTVRNYNPPRAIRGPDAFPNRNVQVSSRATALESDRGRSHFTVDGARAGSRERTRVYAGDASTRLRDVRLSESKPDFARATRTSPISASRESEIARERMSNRAEAGTRGETIRGRGDASHDAPRGDSSRATRTPGSTRGSESRSVPDSPRGNVARTAPDNRIMDRGPRGNTDRETPTVPPRRTETRTAPEGRSNPSADNRSERSPRVTGVPDRSDARTTVPRTVEPRSTNRTVETPSRTPSRAAVPERNNYIRTQPSYERTPQSPDQGVQRRSYPSTVAPRESRSIPQAEAPRYVAPRVERQAPAPSAPREIAPRYSAPQVDRSPVSRPQAAPRIAAPPAESRRSAPSYSAPSRGSSGGGRSIGAPRVEAPSGGRGSVSRSQR